MSREIEMPLEVDRAREIPMEIREMIPVEWMCLDEPVVDLEGWLDRKEQRQRDQARRAFSWGVFFGVVVTIVAYWIVAYWVWVVG